MFADFHHYYPGLALGDVVQRWDPTAVLELIGWLPDNGPYAAARAGGKQFLGWGKDRALQADLWDLHAAVAMAGSKKKKVRYPRPVKAAMKRTWRTLAAHLRRQAGTVTEGPEVSSG